EQRHGLQGVAEFKLQTRRRLRDGRVQQAAVPGMAAQAAGHAKHAAGGGGVEGGHRGSPGGGQGSISSSAAQATSKTPLTMSTPRRAIGLVSQRASEAPRPAHSNRHGAGIS